MIFLFSSNTGAMLATKTLRDSGVEARMLPAPAGMSSRANLCLSIEAGAESRAMSALESAKLEVTVVH